tara:strand:- start:206 stop:2083 length:1878 start_codon:yes stop_codon:yes gene_type:complete
MINQIGAYSLYICLFASIYLIFKSFVSSKNFEKKKIDQIFFPILSVQLFFTLLSFLTLVLAFIISDFSNITVFNNSHTLKPIFYKISGTWGNHEGSLLLWLLVLTLFLYIFFITSKKLNIKYKLLTILIQEIIIFGFLLFILFTSNPFLSIFPTPNEGLGLNPILQDPALAIHPPLLYVGYVGTSIIFSASLAALISGNVDKVWASHIKNWILVSWIFLSVGILLGSIWAYYELGWGGFWFWDPVENVSLMPWFCLTALLHSIVVLKNRNMFHSWTIILSITTFSLSMSGTFLVRSGILNSIHTFANDPSRGIFILTFLLFLVLLAVFIFFFNQKNIPDNPQKSFLISRETGILVNNWFMMFFLSVVLVGTAYPIFLEVINDAKISVGPPFYHKLIIPFLIPFLFFMALGPNIKWIKDNIDKKKLSQIVIFVLCFGISFLVVMKTNTKFLFSTLLFTFSFYLFFTVIRSFQQKNSNISQKISHLGFSIFMLSILFNSILSKENSANMRVGDEMNFLNKKIIFENIRIENASNFKKLIGEFKLKENENIIEFNPEIRVYSQPETITSEADIFSTFFSDNFLVFSIIKNDGYFNVRYQYKPLMIWIWISVLLMSLGGVLSFLREDEK